jgi:CheY-like chemotaxis protein
MRKKRILVVDDEASITTLLQLNLEKTGDYTVRTANHGEQVLPAVREFKPDVVLLDVMMPGMDGGVVAEKIQTSPDCKDVSLVFLTAAVKREEIEACGGVIGGFPYVAKPLNVKGVISVIEKQLAGRLFD